MAMQWYKADPNLFTKSYLLFPPVLGVSRGLLSSKVRHQSHLFLGFHSSNSLLICTQIWFCWTNKDQLLGRSSNPTHLCVNSHCFATRRRRSRHLRRSPSGLSPSTSHPAPNGPIAANSSVSQRERAKEWREGAGGGGVSGKGKKPDQDRPTDRPLSLCCSKRQGSLKRFVTK